MLYPGRFILVESVHLLILPFHCECPFRIQMLTDKKKANRSFTLGIQESMKVSLVTQAKLTEINGRSTPETTTTALIGFLFSFKKLRTRLKHK